MSKCVVKLSPLMTPIVSLVVDRNTSTTIRILGRKSKNGPATALIVRISAGLIPMTEDQNLLFRVVNPGEEAQDNASICILHSDDGQSVRVEPLSGLAI